MRLLFCLLLAVTLQAAPRHWMAAGACMASAVDFGTTAYGAQQRNVRENNPLFRNAAGGPSLWKMGVFKAGVCAVTVWSAHKRPESMFVSSPQMMIFGWATVHNLRVINKGNTQ